MLSILNFGPFLVFWGLYGGLKFASVSNLKLWCQITYVLILHSKFKKIINLRIFPKIPTTSLKEWGKQWRRNHQVKSSTHVSIPYWKFWNSIVLDFLSPPTSASPHLPSVWNEKGWKLKSFSTRFEISRSNYLWYDTSFKIL